MNELILNTQENVALKEDATKRKQSLVKETAHYYHIDRDIIYAYAEYKHYKGNGWCNDNPLELDKAEHFKDKISPTFIKLLKIIDTLKELDELEFLQPYLDAMRNNGVTITISPSNKQLDKEFLNSQMELIDEEQRIICDNTDVLKETGVLAEEKEFSTKSKFKTLTESYYKITCTTKGDKAADKLSKQLVNNTMDNSAIGSILSETEK